MTQETFEYNGHTCIVTYDGGLPNYLVDGQVIPSSVVLDNNIEHVGESMEFWVEKLKEYLDSK